MLTGGYSRGFEVPRDQHRFIYIHVCIRSCGTLKHAFLRAKPEHSMCTAAPTVTLCDKHKCIIGCFVIVNLCRRSVDGFFVFVPIVPSP